MLKVPAPPPPPEPVIVTLTGTVDELEQPALLVTVNTTFLVPEVA